MHTPPHACGRWSNCSTTRPRAHPPRFIH